MNTLASDSAVPYWATYCQRDGRFSAEVIRAVALYQGRLPELRELVLNDRLPAEYLRAHYWMTCYNPSLGDVFFVVSNPAVPDRRLYLLGSFHLRYDPPGAKAPPLEIRPILPYLEGSRVYYEAVLEGLLPEVIAAAQISIQEFAHRHPHVREFLVQKLGVELLRRIAEGQNRGQGMGRDGRNILFGTETTLTDYLNRTNPEPRRFPIGSLENASTQGKVLGLNALAILLTYNDPSASEQDTHHALFDAMHAGNLEELSQLVHETTTESSTVVDALMEEQRQFHILRNHGMANRLAAILARTPKTFACIGAGHLVGPEGIPALLKRAGLSVRRIHRSLFPTIVVTDADEP